MSLILFIQSTVFCALIDPLQNTSDTSVIATLGNYEITLKEFIDSYEFGPSFVKKSQDPKMTQLQYMINEKLIALDGLANGINTDSSFCRMLKEIEDDIIVTEWYRQKIVPLVVVDSSLIKSGIEQNSFELTFRYILTKNEFYIQDIKSLLDSGNSFDSLYLELKQNPNFYLEEISTNFFTLVEKNPQVARALASLKPGAYSDIINTEDGFYLVRLDHAQKDFIITPNEYMTKWSNVERFYTKKELDSLTIAYVKGKMEECPPTISGEALKLIFKLFSKTDVSNSMDQEEQIFKVHFNPELILNEDPGSEILVSSHCDKFTLKDFIDWYSYRNFRIDFSKETVSTLNFLKDVIFKMVRDKRLIRIARHEGYADDPSVQFEVQVWRDKLAYWKQKSMVIKPSALTEEELRSFYETNKIKYEKNAKGKSITYESVKEKVKNDLMLSNYNKQLYNYLTSLEEKYPIKINRDLLNSVHVSDEKQSKKIDLFIYKKGGTLPRQAFPTIDNEWSYY